MLRGGVGSGRGVYSLHYLVIAGDKNEWINKQKATYKKRLKHLLLVKSFKCNVLDQGLMNSLTLGPAAAIGMCI
jgi:hypothetical protein